MNFFTVMMIYKIINVRTCLNTGLNHVILYNLEGVFKRGCSSPGTECCHG